MTSATASRCDARGLFLAVLALLCQIGFGAALGPLASPAADPLTALTICHSGPPADTGGAPAPHHGADCALCPLCCALHAATLLPELVAASAAPIVSSAEPVRPPPARAPPQAVLLAATYPTGPPHLA